MTKHQIGIVSAALAALLLGAATAACSQRSDPSAGAVASVIAGPAGDQFRAAGREASITVLPTRVAGQPLAPVGEVVAMMLERGGMKNLQLSDAAITPPDGADAAVTARSLAEHVRADPPATDYVLYTEFLGSPQQGIGEIRSIVAAKDGAIVWLDRQARGDAAFDGARPREPMEGCLFVAQRLRPVLGLSDPSKQSSPAEGGRIAKEWGRRTGIPDKAELKQIEARGEAFRKVAATSTLLVYPAHAGTEFSGESAKNLSERINQKGLAKASAAANGPQPAITRSMNQQEVLWSMVRGVSDHVRQNPPDADYVIFADYLMGDGRVGGVHFVICNRMGEIVALDLQNSHWPDFKAIHPATREDCDRLVVKRLEAFCR